MAYLFVKQFLVKVILTSYYKMVITVFIGNHDTFNIKIVTDLLVI